MEDYKLKVSYLNDQFSRMWTRFNFFLTIESGLVAGQIFAENSKDFNLRDIHLALVFISVLWYVFGAQDKYLVDNYRNQVEDSFNRLKLSKETELQKIDEDVSYVGDVRMKNYREKRKKRLPGEEDIQADFHSLASWRIGKLSITHLAAYVPLLLVLVWLGVLIFSKYPSL